MRRLAAAAIACAALGAPAEEGQWYLTSENDAGFNVDRWYTSGLRLGRSEPVDRASERFALGLFRPDSVLEQRLEWGLRHELYTRDPRRSDWPDPDRPNAGRLLGFVARHDYTAEAHQSLEAAIGVRGPSAQGKRSQSAIHRAVRARHIDWSRQLPDRLDASLAWSRSDARALPFRKGDVAAVLHRGFVAGNILTFAHAGFEVRYGAGGPGGAWSSLLRFAPTPLVHRARRGWNAFAGASARYVARNALLSPRFDDAAEVPPRRGVLRMAAGIAWSAAWGVLTVAVAEDSREFEGQHSLQPFGAVGVRLDF